jgi:flagellin
MGLRINTNIPSLIAQNNLARITEQLTGSYRRLSSGLRIATAADDAAGLAISERLRAQVRSLEQAKRNANDGLSLAQVAEGSLSEVSDMLVRMRELAVQSANGTTSNDDKNTLQEEFAALVAEIDRMARAASFTGTKLLDGSVTQVLFQVGAGTDPTIDRIAVTLSAALATSLSLNSLDIGSGGNTTLAITNVDAAITAVNSLRGRFAAAQRRLDTTINNLGVVIENLSAAESRIRDVDVAAETAFLTRTTILQQAAVAVLAQANVQPQLALSLLR